MHSNILLNHTFVLMMRFLKHIGLLVGIACCLSSCKKDFYADSPSDKLSFSTDTVSFDTVFTERGSITQCFKILNNCDGIVKIDKIYLENGSSSEFYINVNGQQGPIVKNLEIDAGDSIFVFVQTKLNEQKRDTALYHEEKLLVDYNSIQSKVIITAWGQDVVNFKGDCIGTTTFTADKPYVIYDSLVVKEGETLTINAGARIYLHYNANIIIYGALKIQGTLESPVQFSSDRLEETYQLLPGQWGSIIFKPTSSNNSIDYAIIKNGVNGLLFSGDGTHEISCDISNSRISNMSGYGIYAQVARINSYNCIFANCEYSVVNILGGQFNSVHNTISNEGTPSGRKYYPSVQISDFVADTVTYALKLVAFYNSIIVGSMTNEITISSKNNTSLPCSFQNCLLRDTYTKVDSVYYKDNSFYDKEKKLFASSTSFVLDTLSQAENIGNINYANLYPNDLHNHSRISDEKPDVGALEYYYEEKKD